MNLKKYFTNNEAFLKTYITCEYESEPMSAWRKRTPLVLSDSLQSAIVVGPEFK